MSRRRLPAACSQSVWISEGVSSVGLAGMGQAEGARRHADGKRSDSNGNRTSGTSCAAACHAESERQAGASWTNGDALIILIIDCPCRFV
jgi:hypothetical protein